MFKSSLVLQKNRHPTNINDKVNVNRTKSNRASFDFYSKGYYIIHYWIFFFFFVNEDYQRQNGYDGLSTTISSLVAQTVKRLSTMRETWIRSLGQEDPLEKEMAIHSSTIAWKIPWTEELGRLQSMGLQRVGHD